MRATSALCFELGQRVEEKQPFKRGTYGLAAFSMHTFELLQLTLKSRVSFVGSAHNAFRRWFVGGSMIGLGIRARPFESVSGNTECGGRDEHFTVSPGTSDGLASVNRSVFSRKAPCL